LFPQIQPLLEKMYRGARNPRKKEYLKSMIRSFKLVNVSTFGGIDIGKQPALIINSKRLGLTIERYLRGLHYCIFNSRVHNEAKIKVVINPEAILENREKFLEEFKTAKLFVVQTKVFSFKYGTIIERPGSSVWLLEFYERLPIFGIILTPIVEGAFGEDRGSRIVELLGTKKVE
jgi:hypothetical protein